MLNCTCHNIDQSEFLLTFEYQGTKATPYLTHKAIQYIGDNWAQTADTMIYLLCEEMHWQCINIRKSNEPNEAMKYVSRFICCKRHNIIKLTQPVAWVYYKWAGIPGDITKELPIPLIDQFPDLDKRKHNHE